VVISLWQILKNYLNDNLQDCEKRRKDILIELRDITVWSLIDSHTNTIDTYLNYLHKAGYLYKPRRGIYGLIHEIETDLSIDDVKNQAYGKLSYDVIRKIIIELPREDFFKEEEFAI
jgi:hypothetical protein